MVPSTVDHHVTIEAEVVVEIKANKCDAAFLAQSPIGLGVTPHVGSQMSLHDTLRGVPVNPAGRGLMLVNYTLCVCLH